MDINSFPLSDCMFSGFLLSASNIDSRALFTSCPVFLRSILTHEYFENTSIATNKYLYPSLYGARLLNTAKSTCQRSSILFTMYLFHGNIFLFGTCNV